MYEDFTTFEAMIDDAIKEAAYFAGYGSVIEKTYLLPEDKEEGKELVKRANSARAALYRAKTDRAAAALEKQEKIDAGTFDEAVWEKEKKKAEDKILTLAFDVVRLRIPFDNFLFGNEIPERKPYNAKAPRMGKLKRAAEGLA